MRHVMLALLGLLLLVPPALAGKRADPADAARAAVAKPAVQAAKPKLAQPQRGQAQRAVPGARPVAAALPAACGRKGAPACRQAQVVRARWGWAQGLPPAANVQQNECPDGTLATLARGHDDVVRCMPI